MKKRIMSLLLVMLMVFSLLPAAFAIENPEPAADEDNSLHLTKQLEMDESTGDYKLTLQGWSTGVTKVIEKVEAVPTDIVLVVDLSHSMHLDDEGGRHYKDIIDENGNEIYRIEAVQKVVERFINTVKTKDGGKGIYRIAIVSFAHSTDFNAPGTTNGGNFIFDGKNAYYNRFTTEIYRNALKNVDAQGVADLNDTIYESDPFKNVNYNQTAPKNGLKFAYDILNNRTETDKQNRAEAVVLFTDGEPGYGNLALEIYADPAVQQAAALKNMGAKVFTVGLFNFDDTAKMHVRYTTDTSAYSVQDYMQRTSSDYQQATSISNAGTKDPDNEYYSQVNTAGGSASISELDAVFQSIATSISESSTTVTIGTQAVLRDVVNLENFSVPAGSTASAKVYNATINAQGQIQRGTLDSERTASLNIKPTGTDADGNPVYEVSGFDYEHNFITAEHPGYILVVEITGLTPVKSGDELDSNVGPAGIYSDDKPQSVAVVDIPTPIETIEAVPHIIDFNAKMTLADGIARWKAVNENNGTFADGKNAGELTYQLKPLETLGDRYGSLIMNGVDTAMAYNGTEWKEYQTIPANNIYFDDALLSKTVDVGDGSGYNAGVTSSVAQAVKDVDDGAELVFTFKGTGIDIYCTTNADGGYVQAGLMTGAAKDPSKLVYFESTEGHYYKDGSNYVRIDEEHPAPDGAQRYDSSLLAVRNYSITPSGEGDATLDRYNVPTVSYTGLPYGTYTVRLWTVENANYKLDGIRVYNAMADDESVYAGTNEANARFFNLREALVNDGQNVNVTVKTQDEKQVMETYLEGQASALLPGVLFIDNKNSLKLEKTVVDANGSFVLDDNGEPKKTLVYQDAFSAYVANGPKNEIYLAKDQGIAFNISAAARGDHYWVGLSIPDQGSTTPSVTVNDQTVKPSVASAVDMYYPITPREDGTVVIVNHGDAMIAVTNLKVTKAPAAAEDPDAFPGASPFALLSTEALDLAANSSEALSQDDGGNPGMQELIRQLISSFVKALFNNISRLFGK